MLLHFPLWSTFNIQNTYTVYDGKWFRVWSYNMKQYDVIYYAMELKLFGHSEIMLEQSSHIIGCQEQSDGRQIVCGSIALDNSGQEILNRVGNRTYEQARAGKISLPGFPDFSPHVAALKNDNTTTENKSYRVTAQVHDRLVLLETLTKKWLEEESTCEEAREIVDAHNQEYNAEGDFMSDRREVNQVSNQNKIISLEMFYIEILRHYIPGWLWLTVKANKHRFMSRPICDLHTSKQLRAADNENDGAVAEPPAKRIKIEKTSAEDVSKLSNVNLFKISHTWCFSQADQKYDISNGIQDLQYHHCPIGLNLCFETIGFVKSKENIAAEQHLWLGGWRWWWSASLHHLARRESVLRKAWAVTRILQDSMGWLKDHGSKIVFFPVP